METEELLELRKKLKKKKPNFVRRGCQKRLKKKWRRPRGLHSKVRLMFKGKLKKISTGFSSPKQVRSLHRSGLKPVLVSSLKGINKIKKETEGVIIGSSVGLKKRYELVKKLNELKIKILNIKNIGEYLKKVEDELKARKDKKKTLKEKKEKKKEEKPKKEEKLSEKIEEEEKKKEEKKEKDKVLTKKV